MMKKRLLSLLLVLVLAFTLVPSAFAAGCGVSSCVCPSSKSCHMYYSEHRYSNYDNNAYWPAFEPHSIVALFDRKLFNLYRRLLYETHIPSASEFY